MNKKRKKFVISIVVCLMGIVFGAQGSSICEAAGGKISRSFEYTGYSSPEYKSFVRSSHYVSMFDGVKLALDAYLPSSGGQSDRPFPVLFSYHPYRRATIDPESGEIKQTFPGLDRFIQFFTSYGYGVVIADMRGSGASFGSRLDMSPQLGKDGKQVIDWIETQPWCNGSVGMFGGSYLGWSQFAVAGQKPRALKAIMPEVWLFDTFSGGAYYCDGIYNRGIAHAWAQIVSLQDRAAYIPGGKPPLLPALPVVDEDHDGELADEIPLDLNTNHFFFDDPPTYSDGGKRQHFYYHAVKEHLANRDPKQWTKAASFRDSQIADTTCTWTDLGPSDWPARIAESGVAIYHVGAWFDFFARGTTRWYATLKATSPSKMFMHPSFHSGPDLTAPPAAGPYWNYFGEDLEQFVKGLLKERLRFFDRYLKGIRNGIDTEPPVLIYVMKGEGWRSENEWPLARQVISKYYFNEGNALSAVKSVEGTDRYKADFGHDSNSGAERASRWQLLLPQDQPMKRTQKDLQCLTYTTNPLKKNTEVTGHPIVHLWVSSTADHGDFFVYLEDVDENGEAYYVTEGKLRAGFAGLVPEEEILPAEVKMDVLPDLPYHGFKDTNYVDGILAGGKVVELVFDLYPTSWVFSKGHRIRVSIACADWPTFDLHPKLSPQNDPHDPANTIPTITIHRDGKYPSRIELPIILKRVPE